MILLSSITSRWVWRYIETIHWKLYKSSYIIRCIESCIRAAYYSHFRTFFRIAYVIWIQDGGWHPMCTHSSGEAHLYQGEASVSRWRHERASSLGVLGACKFVKTGAIVIFCVIGTIIMYPRHVLSYWVPQAWIFSFNGVNVRVLRHRDRSLSAQRHAVSLWFMQSMGYVSGSIGLLIFCCLRQPLSRAPSTVTLTLLFSWRLLVAWILTLTRKRSVPQHHGTDYARTCMLLCSARSLNPTC